MLSKLYKKYKNRQRNVKCDKGYATFHIDELSIFRFSGWVYVNNYESAKPCHVSFKLNSTLVCQTHASVLRDDLKKAGIANGDCGFSIEPNWQVFETGDNLIVMYVNGKPVHVFNVKITTKQLMVAMTGQIHRQIDLAKEEVIKLISGQ